MIYFDQAASSWPKPEKVSQAMVEAIHKYAANPGRGSHQLSVRANNVINKTRSALARLFCVADEKNIIFFSNATTALNQAIKGIQWQRGDEVLTTQFEHNSVRRPLENICQKFGVHIRFLPVTLDGQMDKNELRRLFNERTKLVVVNHMSNLTGTILPIAEIGHECAKHSVPFLVDASQSAGHLPIDVQQMNIDLLAFPGHKGLYGPQGTGGLYISPRIELEPIYHGGTGSHSQLSDQPKLRPTRYESGTLNTPGIAGLYEGVQFLLNTGINNIWKREMYLTHYALQYMKELKNITLYGPDIHKPRGPVLAFNIADIDPQEVAMILDQHYNIATRAGVHCTPWAHESIRTMPQGAVRISFGYFNTIEEVDVLVEALQEMIQGLLID